MQVQLEKIPQFLKDNGQFCNWKYELRDGNQTKVPYTPGTTRRASVSDPATFTAFETAATQRITKPDSIIQRLYEDNLDGKISDERFAKMTATYEQERKDLTARVIVLRETLSKAKAQRLNIDSFLAQVKKYTEVKELDAEIIRALVERIDVFKPEKVPGTRTKKQTILIHWNFIGAVELPQEQKKSA